MLHSIKSIIDYAIKAKDGDIGKVVDFYFDDEEWKIRYLVADIGGLIFGKKVLISPAAFYGRPKWEEREFPVILTTEMVKKCPDVDMDKPVSRQKEAELAKYYNWPLYWTPMFGVPAAPLIPPKMEPLKKSLPSQKKTAEDSHLRSSKEVFNYHIEAHDGEVGHVDDIIIDDESWDIRYAVVETRNWLPGKKVLISPRWIRKISWAESKVKVDLSREQIKGSPVYNPEAPVNRQYEERLYDYYGRPKYWI